MNRLTNKMTVYALLVAIMLAAGIAYTFAHSTTVAPTAGNTIGNPTIISEQDPQTPTPAPVGGQVKITETRITTDPAYHVDPAIYGNIIVWVDTRNGPSDIYMYNLSTGVETQITKHQASQGSGTPAVYGNLIVWAEVRSGLVDIYMYDVSTGVETPITKDPAYQSHPAVYGNIIVWADHRNSPYPDIYMYNLSSHVETPITTERWSQGFPDIYGDLIVWQDMRSGRDTDIYMYNLTSHAETQITTSPANQEKPKVYGDIIVWTDWRNSQQPDIYMYNLSSHVETQVNYPAVTYEADPDVYGNIVVWAGQVLTTSDIFMYDLSTHVQTQVTTAPKAQFSPEVYSDIIVWMDCRNGEYDLQVFDIYMGRISPADTTPPETTATLSDNQGSDDWYLSPVTVTLTATDEYSGVAETLYKINGGPWLDYGAPFTIEDEGVTTVFFYSTDGAGNVEATKSVDVKIDTRAPTTELAFAPQYTDALGNIYVTSGTSFTLTPMDPTPGSGLYGTYYTINGVQKEYSGAFSLPGPDGAYTINYWSSDIAGNTETQKTVTVNFVSLEVDSHVSQGVSGPTLISFDAVFTKDKPDGYKLVSTNPGEFFYVVDVTNTWPITIGTLTINLEIPVDFGLKGETPITIYLDGTDITGLCTITGTTVTVADVPAGSTVQVVAHLDYALKGNHYESLSEFGMKGYVFHASVSGSNCLLGTYVSSAELKAHPKTTTAIAGYVTDANGNPLAGVTVELLDSIGPRYAVTDENGFYYFIGLAAGDYQVTVCYDGVPYTTPVSVQDQQLAQVDIKIP